MKLKKLYALLWLAVIGLFLGCTPDGEGQLNQSKTGKLVIRMTDAPFPVDLVESANVTVFKMDARLKDDGENPDDSSEGSPFIVLMEEEVPVNLLDLTNGVVQELVDAEVPAGIYDLVRMYVKGVNVVMKDGTVYDLKVPSGEQTGIKIFIEPELQVVGGLTSELILDFDVSRSFVPKGDFNTANGISGFNFKPVIKAMNESVAGRLIGTITEEGSGNALEGAKITVLQDGEEVTSTFSGVDGGYVIMALLAGTYDVEVSLDLYEPNGASGIEIVAANKTVQDFELELADVVSEAGDVFRLNSGGPAYSIDMTDWSADAYFGGGNTFANAVEIANTSDPEVYQTERFATDGSITYSIPVPDGNYDINLHFAEIFYGQEGEGSEGGEGSRVFGVDIENGQDGLVDYDIFLEAGGTATAVIESFGGILVEDGRLTITFTSVTDNAKISGIEITKL